MGILIWTVIFFSLLYFTCTRYTYLINVIFYIIGMGIIPAIISGNTFVTIIVLIAIRAVMGLILIKVLMKIIDYWDNGVIFFIAGYALEVILSKFIVTAIISLL